MMFDAMDRSGKLRVIHACQEFAQISTPPGIAQTIHQQPRAGPVEQRIRELLPYRGPRMGVDGYFSDGVKANPRCRQTVMNGFHWEPRHMLPTAEPFLLGSRNQFTVAKHAS